MAGTKTELFWGFTILWIFYTLILQTFAFVSGAPSFFSKSINGNPVTFIQQFSSLFGFGTFTGAPLALIFIISVALPTIYIYLLIETVRG